MWRPTYLVGLLLGASTLLAPVVEASLNLNMTEVLAMFPDCATACLLEVGNQTNCEGEDAAVAACYCSSPSFDSRAQSCIVGACTTPESLYARNVTQTVCERPIRDNSVTMYAVGTAFSILSGLFVIQRFAVKLLARNMDVGLDDWITLAAAVVQAPAVALICVPGIENGLGKDIWTLTPAQITDFLYYLYVFTTIYFTNLAIVKLAFLFFYLRVFPRPLIRRLLWSTIIFVMAWGIVFLFVSVFQCRPLSYYWHRWDGEHEGSCVNPSAVAWANAVISITLDVWMIGIPLSQLRGLNLDWKKKVGVGAMFSLGLFVTIISIVRLISLVQHPWDDPNATWAKIDVALWSTVEINVGIICACLPSLRSLIVRIFPGLNVWATEADGSGRHDFIEKNLGFGTTSRSVAEKHPNFPMPTRPGAIALHRTYAVEFGTRESEDEQGLVPMKSLDKLSSSGDSSSSPSNKSRQLRMGSPY